MAFSTIYLILAAIGFILTGFALFGSRRRKVILSPWTAFSLAILLTSAAVESPSIAYPLVGLAVLLLVADLLKKTKNNNA